MTTTTPRALFYRPGEADGVDLRGTRVTFLATAADASGGSVFEFRAAPGFSTGVHVHGHIEEYFYVLDGAFEFVLGDERVQAGRGAFVFVPPGTPHGFGNAGSTPATLLLTTTPPGHEDYFAGLAEVLANPGPPDAEKIADLRRRFDTEQLSSLKG